MDEATKRQVEDLMGRGFVTAQFFTTGDAMAEYERLVAAGVDVMGAPTQQPYGIDFGFRDPSGNSYRVAQR
jgi:predicted enzyme related to lactoylglutathione lyase